MENVYVADHGNYRIQVFSPSTTPVTPATQPQSIIHAELIASPIRGSSPLSVQFYDTSTSNTSKITAWAWDFGDGTTSLVQLPSHTYTTSGNYTIKLYVTTADRTGSIIKSDLITVNTPPSTIPTTMVPTAPPAMNSTPKPTNVPLSPLPAVAGVGVVCLLHMAMRRM